MIINETQIKEILLKEVTDLVEWLDIIRAYIYEKKGVDIGQIKYPNPNHPHFQLFLIAQDTCWKHYAEKLLKPITE